jgi:hypothetical protein
MMTPFQTSGHARVICSCMLKHGTLALRRFAFIEMHELFSMPGVKLFVRLINSIVKQAKNLSIMCVGLALFAGCSSAPTKLEVARRLMIEVL